MRGEDTGTYDGTGNEPGRREQPHPRWDPLADNPVGPDDVGNVAVHALAWMSDRWRRLRARIGSR